MLVFAAVLLFSLFQFFVVIFHIFHYQYNANSETKNDFDHLSIIGRFILITPI